MNSTPTIQEHWHSNLQPERISWTALIVAFGIPAVTSLVLFGASQQAIALLPGFLSLLVGVMLFPERFILLLPFFGAMSGWVIQISGVTVRLDQALGGILTIPLVLRLAMGKIRWIRSRINFFVYLFLSVNCLSSVLSEDPKSSLFQLVNISSSILIYFVLLNMIETRKEYQLFLNAMLLAGFCGMLYGLSLFVLGVLGVGVSGVNIHEGEVGFGIYGSMREPNIFGSYSASMLLIGLTFLICGDQESTIKKKYSGLFSIAAIFALLLSYARAAWMGAFCGVLLLFRYSRKWKRPASFQLWATIGLTIAVVFVLFASGVLPSGLYLYKIQNLLNFEEGTGLDRSIDWVQAWSNFGDRPWIGNGTFSYSYLNAQRARGEGPLGNAWISNLLLLVLHDTGLIGMAVFLALLWAIFYEAKQTIENLRGSHYKCDALAYQAAFLSLLVAFLATSAFSYGYTWILIGMIPLSRRLQRSEPSPTH